ncbi:LysR family transcriptional regulator [Psychromonas algicola]|uniref:LysR family transcriptional regulator n=1 Tax=Psychromonas algicola TaxID=2555642 RepID=UPI0010675FFC|nr:LysR family transcriptional regulator [Psychromonas sp. RZ5]TEW51244.1 LysR family transcriptional regulator [Psychromonas sp. RZ5]
MEIKTLKSFIAVATLKNFSLAAKQLHSTQPTVSRQISELERCVGVKLLVRTTHGVELTEAGKCLLIEGTKIINNDVKVIEQLRSISGINTKSINIGYLASACAEFLPRMIKIYSSLYPDVKLELLEMTTPQQFDALQNNKIDIAFCRQLADIEPHALFERHLYTDKMVAMVPSQHSLANRSSLVLSDLIQEKIILFKRQDAAELYDKIILSCKSSGFIPIINGHAENMRNLITLVASGLGVSIVPELTRYICPAECKYIPISDLSISLELNMYFKNRASKRHIKQFTEVCIKEMAIDKKIELLNVC